MSHIKASYTKIKQAVIQSTNCNQSRSLLSASYPYICHHFPMAAMYDLGRTISFCESSFLNDLTKKLANDITKLPCLPHGPMTVSSTKKIVARIKQNIYSSHF